MKKKGYLDLIGIIHKNIKSKNLARMNKMINKINRINRSITSINHLAKKKAADASLVKKM